VELKSKKKYASYGITLGVILMLVLLAPAQALNLNIHGLQNQPYRTGETIKFTSDIDILGNERLSVENISLYVNQEKVCTFSVSG
jgi:hypothetical protein